MIEGRTGYHLLRAEVNHRKIHEAKEFLRAFHVGRHGAIGHVRGLLDVKAESLCPGGPRGDLLGLSHGLHGFLDLLDEEHRLASDEGGGSRRHLDDAWATPVEAYLFSLLFGANGNCFEVLP